MINEGNHKVRKEKLDNSVQMKKKRKEKMK